MLKHTFWGAIFAALSLVGSAVCAEDISGVYAGTYTVIQIPGEHKIVLVLRQSGSALMGSFHTASGVDGEGYGLLRGNKAQMFWRNTTPSCPGTYKGEYTFEGKTVTWTYSGEGCLGPEEGKGKASRVMDF